MPIFCPKNACQATETTQPIATPTTSVWHLSLRQTVILDISIEKTSPGNIPGLTLLERRLWGQSFCYEDFAGCTRCKVLNRDTLYQNGGGGGREQDPRFDEERHYLIRYSPKPCGFTCTCSAVPSLTGNLFADENAFAFVRARDVLSGLQNRMLFANPKPLAQSTEETPVGPLTLRVYASENCHRGLYQDDGKSFAFRSGQYLRSHFSCCVMPTGPFTNSSGTREVVLGT